MSEKVPMEVVVHGKGSGFSQEITAGTHHFTADEPIAAGGGDWGPSPYELLLAALGACTSMTIGMYARRKDWPLDTITVRLRHYQVHATDCEECEDHEKSLERIDRDLQLSGNLTAEQKIRLLEIADKCPVHRTLTSKVKIQTRLV